MCWDAINTIAQLVFGMPEAEMKAWVQANKHTLSLAERVYLDACEGNLAVIEALLDRIVGKTLKIDANVGSSDPIMDHYYRLTPEGRAQEIERLLRNREIIEREKESIKKCQIVFGESPNSHSTIKN